MLATQRARQSPCRHFFEVGCDSNERMNGELRKVGMASLILTIISTFPKVKAEWATISGVREGSRGGYRDARWTVSGQKQVALATRRHSLHPCASMTKAATVPAIRACEACGKRLTFAGRNVGPSRAGLECRAVVEGRSMISYLSTTRLLAATIALFLSQTFAANLCQAHETGAQHLHFKKPSEKSVDAVSQKFRAPKAKQNSTQTGQQKEERS